MTNFGGDMKFDGPDLDFTYRKDDDYPLEQIGTQPITDTRVSSSIKFSGWNWL